MTKRSAVAIRNDILVFAAIVLVCVALNLSFWVCLAVGIAIGVASNFILPR